MANVTVDFLIMVAKVEWVWLARMPSRGRGLWKNTCTREKLNGEQREEKKVSEKC